MNDLRDIANRSLTSTPPFTAGPFDETTAGGPKPTDGTAPDETDGAGCQNGDPSRPLGSDHLQRKNVAEGQQTRLTHIQELKADPSNRRRHNARNIRMVTDALRGVGAARSIVIDEDGVILAGNGTIEAAAEAGITRVQVVEADGETIIAVRRRGLSVEQKRALALYDNRSSELATWDLSQLQADVDAGLNLDPFFDATELADLLGAGAPVPDFTEATEGEQGRLDQLEPVTCPSCGHTFSREDRR